MKNQGKSIAICKFRAVVAVTCLTLAGIASMTRAGTIAVGDHQVIRPSSRVVPTYTVTPITPGWISDTSFAINNNGAVVGQNHLKAFAWIPSAPNATTGTIHDLPSLTPTATAAGLGIDDNNRVVGWSRDSASRPNPVSWSGNYASAQTLALRTDAVGGRAVGVNSSGVVVGATGWTATDMHLARWNTDGSLDDLGLPAGAMYAQGKAINNSGMIAGSAAINGNQIAFRYFNDQYQMLPLPGATNTSDVNWMNNNGVAVGSANGAWWSDGTTSQYLNVVPGVTASRAANGINDKGVIVGTSVVGTHANVPVGSIWFGTNDRGWMLNDLIDQTTSAGYLVREAYAINNSGQIAVGAITPAGAYVAALLTPTGTRSALQPTLNAVPEPAAIVVVGWIGMLASRRRRCGRA
jgi:hypothetical protein